MRITCLYEYPKLSKVSAFMSAEVPESSGVLLGKLIVSHLVKNFLVLYSTLRCIAVFTRTRHQTLS
jgi:hypothetical protein